MGTSSSAAEALACTHHQAWVEVVMPLARGAGRPWVWEEVGRPSAWAEEAREGEVKAVGTSSSASEALACTPHHVALGGEEKERGEERREGERKAESSLRADDALPF